MPSPIGHALGGVAAAWLVDLIPGPRAWRSARASASWFKRAGNGLTVACAALAIAPDLDVLVGGHRMMTHSVGAVIIVGLAAAAIAAYAERPILRVALMCAAAYGTHPLLDLLAVDRFWPYGLQLLWPFSQAWLISGWDLFALTERRDLMTLPAIRQNAAAVAQEIAILGPLVVLLWLIRVKTLAGLASEMSGGHHSSQ